MIRFFRLTERPAWLDALPTATLPADELIDAVKAVPPHYVDLTITPANVAAQSGASIDRSGTAGAAITAGQVVYKDSADGNKLKLADANAGTEGADVRRPYGIALHGASAGQPLAVLTGGDINLGATITEGTIYILSGTAGGIAPAADLVSGMSTVILGVGTGTAGVIKVQIFDPVQTVP